MVADVVLTGMGMWTPYGRGVRAFWDGLVSAQPVHTGIDRFDACRKQYRTSVAATIPGLGTEAAGYAATAVSDVVDAVLADAMSDAAAAPGDLSPTEVSVILGVSNALPPQQRIDKRLAETSASFGLFGCGTLVSRIANAVGAAGRILAVSTACASGTQSVGRAFELIRDGRSRRAVAGGLCYFSELSFSGFNILRVLSATGCRPFDERRDGVTLGDAFVVFVLENAELARRRGAAWRARIIGYASGNEAFHATAPDPQGTSALRVMRLALAAQAGALERLDYVNAHGTGTPANDVAELTAIARLVADRATAEPVAVSSTKGHHGHALGAAGSIELAATLLALNFGKVPPTVGLTRPVPHHERLHLVMGAPAERDIRVALSNSFAFGGNVASIAVAAP